MKDRIYSFSRDVGPEDWRALPRKFTKGETVARWSGYTYGLDRDDMVYGGRETIPCTLDGESFFTVPVEFLVSSEGHKPMGDYVRLDNPREPV
jgi:hypothetical protein